MGAIQTILKLLTALAELFNRSQRKKQQQEHEANVDKIEQDPVAFLDDHFNGDSGLRPNDLSDYAANADKAKVAEHNQDK